MGRRMRESRKIIGAVLAASILSSIVTASGMPNERTYMQAVVRMLEYAGCAQRNCAPTSAECAREEGTQLSQSGTM
jgi:hypothetical protein